LVKSAVSNEPGTVAGDQDVVAFHWPAVGPVPVAVQVNVDPDIRFSSGF
jgi:hypothetical protein